MRLTALGLLLSIIFSFFSPIALAETDINVTGTVPAQASDFQIEIESLTSGSPFPQDTEIEYQVTYGSYLSYPVTFTLQAQWYQGTIDGEASPSVDVVEYVVGSATNGYNSATPVVNTTNKTISWSITLPANTQDQTVNFKLETTDNYTGGSTVSFPVKARILGPGVNTADQTVTLEYRYASAPTPGPTTTPSPTPTPQTLKIEDVDVRQISKDSALIYVETSLSSNIVISYGTNKNGLNRTASSNGLSKSHLVELGGLIPETDYFFKVNAKAAGVGEANSDIFTFRTAKDVAPPEIIQTTFITIINDIVVYDGQSEEGNVILSTNTEFQFKLKVDDKKAVKSIKGYLRNTKVLGIASYLITDAEANTKSVTLVVLPDGSYTGRLKTAPSPGEYQLIIRIEDTAGNISEDKIAELKVTKPFTILNAKEDPIEGARVLLYIYNNEKKLYEKISTLGLAIKNPVFSNSKGELELALPKGKYKAEVSSIRYKDQTVEFSIGSDNYPTVILESTGISPISLFNYYFRGFDDVYLTSTKQYLESLSTSLRFFDLISALSLGALVIVTIFAFSKRHEISPTSLRQYLTYLKNTKSNAHQYIKGLVVDDKGEKIPGANVYLVNESLEEISNGTKTNKQGEFFFKKQALKKDFLVMAMKEGFRTHPLVSYKEGQDLLIKIEEKEHTYTLIHYLKHLFTGTFGLSFEVFLIFSLVFELIFLDTFGLAKTIPYFLITLFNFFIWIIFTRHNQGQARISY